MKFILDYYFRGTIEANTIEEAQQLLDNCIDFGKLRERGIDVTNVTPDITKFEVYDKPVTL